MELGGKPLCCQHGGMEVRPRNNVFTSAQAFVTARAVTTRWYQQPPLGGMPLGERGLMLACCHAAGYDVCPAYPGVCKRGLAGQHRVTHCTAQSSHGRLDRGTGGSVVSKAITLP